ncbi:CAP domain-containing protein [Streptomyces sp. NPDC006530]|uniref:CAP domain-containing protein n=1 Tax=Streptomyces sp. NPDC006530 TaxID=3364750 RepID=UPI0036A84E99
MKPNSFVTAAAMVCGLVLMGPMSAASVAHAQAGSVPAAQDKSAMCPSGDPPPGTGSRMSAADADAMVRGHNEARQEAIKEYHPGLPLVPVTWSPKLACDAQAWADDPESSANGGLHHSKREANGNEGENLLNSTPVPARPTLALDPSLSYSWTAEKAKFDADANAVVQNNAPDGTNYHAWGHYSQMVWMSPASVTTSIGCGVKEGVPVGGGTGWILVCRYAAAGNIDGQRAIPSGGQVAPAPGDWNAKAHAAADVAGRPATLVWPNQQHVFYRGTDGSLKHLFWDAGTNQVYADNWSAKAGAGADVAGDPATMVWPDQQHVFYRSTDGRLKHVFWDSGKNQVFADDWSAKAGAGSDVAGDPATLVWRNQQHVFYRGTDGSLKHLFWDAATNQVYTDNWSAKAHVAADVTGTPATLVWPNQQHVFYRGTDGSLKHLFWDAGTNQVYADNWSAKAGAGADVAGDPATMVWPNQQHVFYRGTDGRLKHVFWDSGKNQVFADDWSAKAGAGSDVAGDPATLVWPNQQHVFYRGADGSLKHLFWDSGRNQVFADDWTAKAHVAADVSDTPAGLLWPDQQHAFYRGKDGAIKQLFWDSPRNQVFAD